MNFEIHNSVYSSIPSIDDCDDWIALTNTVEADKPIYKYCIDGGPFCGEKKTDCKDLLEGTADDHKCLEVRIG